ncbi:MAG TPA: Rieske 2Fe-2S domain-containing protein [Methylomirabilota bacterium]|nr:Rieske 2Fe-2S domain-containing protein [Methylomirabilota bacterium]
MADARPSGIAESAVAVIQRQQWLAPLVEGLQQAVSVAFRAGGRAGQAVKNVLHGTWLGHPLHPVLTDVPIGAWATALVFDTLDARDGGWARRPALQRRADDAILVGIVGALGAALAGLTDWQHTEGGARRTGFVHAGLNTLALGLYAGSLLARRRGGRRAGRALSGAGFGLLLASAYLGGRLVYHDRVGVDHAQREEPTAGRFTRAVRESDLREGQPVRAELGGVRIVLVRRGARVYALGEQCSHLGGPLAEGAVRDDAIVCPWHGSRFALADGRVLDGPATMPQPCFETRVVDGFVEVRRRPESGLAAA